MSLIKDGPPVFVAEAERLRILVWNASQGEIDAGGAPYWIDVRFLKPDGDFFQSILMFPSSKIDVFFGVLKDVQRHLEAQGAS